MARLPLFPLPTVLFPRASLPLHIFEPRYRKMLAAVIERDHRFVLLPPDAQGGPPAIGTVGTIAVLRAVQPLDDGRSNIVVEGEDRVALVGSEPTPDGYLIGTVEPYPDEAATEGASRADLARLDVLGRRLATARNTIYDRTDPPEFATDPAILTFQIAALADWEFPAQHRFLTVRSVTERVARLLASIPGQVARAESRAVVHQRASTNGTGVH